MTAEFVSIVGVSRSGTTLLNKVLDCSSQLAVANENNFLGHLIRRAGIRYKIRKVGDLSDDAKVAEMVDRLYAGEFCRGLLFRNWGHWRWLRDNVDRDELIRRICATGRTDKELFEVFLRCYADDQGKPIIGEKTPSHYKYVDEMLQWFPNGRIVHLIRDPRANFDSELRRRDGLAREKWSLAWKVMGFCRPALHLSVLAVVTCSWAGSVKSLNWGLAHAPDRYLRVRFEDLVGDPEKEIQRICDFLGIEFGQAMMDQKVVRYGFNVGAQGFDADAARRWEQRVPGWVNRWFVKRFGADLRRLGYEPS